MQGIKNCNAQIEILLNNNPRCSAELKNIAKREKCNMTNTPSITVKGTGFEHGKKTIILIFRDKVIAKENISIAEHSFEKTIELPNPLENPKRIEVKVGKTFHEKISVELKRLYGTVTYFDGAPVSYPVISAMGAPVAVGDDNGNFEIFLCRKKKSIGIFEKNYSKSTLECWLYDVDLKEDTKLNVKIDKLEVYELGAWLAYTGLYIHFIPMSLTRISELVKIEGNELATSAHSEAWPHLKKDDVRVFIDEKEVPISTFNEYEDFIGEYKGKKVTRPGYILGVARKDWKKGIIRVEIKHHVELETKEILEKGEGYFFGFVK